MSAPKKPISETSSRTASCKSEGSGRRPNRDHKRGGIRAGIDKGDITLGDVLNVMPFGNTLYVADLTGKQIKQALEQGLSGIEAQGGAFPQVAGLTYTFTLNKKPGHRVLQVAAVQDDGAVKPISDKKTYRVATSNFVGEGGDGYSVFNEASHKEDLGFVDYEVFTERLEKAGKAVEPKVDGRAQEVYLPTKQKNGSWTLEGDSAFAAYAKTQTRRSCITIRMTAPKSRLISA